MSIIYQSFLYSSICPFIHPSIIYHSFMSHLPIYLFIIYQSPIHLFTHLSSILSIYHQSICLFIHLSITIHLFPIHLHPYYFSLPALGISEVLGTRSHSWHFLFLVRVRGCGSAQALQCRGTWETWEISWFSGASRVEQIY